MAAPDYVIHEIGNYGYPQDISSADKALLEQNKIQEDADLEARIAAREAAAQAYCR